MHDAELLPDWDADDHSHRASLDARLAEVIVGHLDNDPLWPNTVTVLADDLTANDEVREMLSRICVLVENFAVWMYGGRDEAIGRFKADLDQLRRIAAMRGAE